MRKSLMLSVPVALLALVPAVAFAQSGTTSGAVGGAVTGAIVGGPIGAVVGGVIGAIVGTVVQPPPATVVTYVSTQTPVPYVTLQGTVAVGATLPATTALYPIPRDIYLPSDNRLYAYAFVNGQRVVVDANTRVIVAIVG
jgi:hypothetical protein